MDLERANRLTRLQFNSHFSSGAISHQIAKAKFYLAVIAILVFAAPLVSQQTYSNRIWSDNSGTFSVEAKLLKINSASVSLRKRNKVRIEVPFSRLSKLDMEYVKIELAKTKPQKKVASSNQTTSTLGEDFLNEKDSVNPTIQQTPESFFAQTQSTGYESNPTSAPQLPTDRVQTATNQTPPQQKSTNSEFAPRPSQRLAQTVEQQSKPQALPQESSVPPTDQATLPNIAKADNTAFNPKFSLGKNYEKPPIVLVSPKQKVEETPAPYQNSLRPNQSTNGIALSTPTTSTQPQNQNQLAASTPKQPASQFAQPELPADFAPPKNQPNSSTAQTKPTTQFNPTPPSSFVPPTNQFATTPNASTAQIKPPTQFKQTTPSNFVPPTNQFTPPAPSQFAKNPASTGSTTKSQTSNTQFNPNTQFGPKPSLTLPNSKSPSEVASTSPLNNSIETGIEPATPMKSGSLIDPPKSTFQPKAPTFQAKTPTFQAKTPTAEPNTPALPEFKLRVAGDNSSSAFGAPPETTPRGSIYNTKSTIVFLASKDEIAQLPTTLQVTANQLVNAKHQSDIRMALDAMESNWPQQSYPVLNKLVQQATKSPDSLTRKLAIEILGKHDSNGSLIYLVQAIEDTDLRVRSSAYTMLGKIANPQTIPALVKRLDSNDRDQAASILSKLGQDAETHVTPYTWHKSVPVQMTACSLLGRIGTSESITPLETVIATTRETKVRLQATNAIKQIQSRTVIR